MAIFRCRWHREETANSIATVYRPLTDDTVKFANKGDWLIVSHSTVRSGGHDLGSLHKRLVFLFDTPLKGGAMAAELRHVIFSKQEVIEAVQVYLRRSGERMPPGVVTRVTIKSGDEIGILFQITEDASNRVHTFYVDGDKLTSALILHCKNIRIPLPFKAQKRLEMVGSNVSILISKNIPLENIRAAKELLFDA